MKKFFPKQGDDIFHLNGTLLFHLSIEEKNE
jgi:hypothetical protein